MDIVERISHRPIAPGIGYPGNRSGVTNSGLVVDVVSAPQGGVFAKQISLFIAELGRAEPVHGIGPDSLRTCSILSPTSSIACSHDNFFHWPSTSFIGVLQAAVAMTMLSQCCTFGAVGASIERG